MQAQKKQRASARPDDTVSRNAPAQSLIRTRDQTATAEALIACADEAMYRAKRSGLGSSFAR